MDRECGNLRNTLCKVQLHLYLPDANVPDVQLKTSSRNLLYARVNAKLKKWVIWEFWVILFF